MSDAITAAGVRTAMERAADRLIELREYLTELDAAIGDGDLGLNMANWRAWLSGKGPILTRLGVDATWDNATATQGNLDVYQPGTVRGGHAVALVGYTPDRFIVRNSWGTGWGDQGYGYASLAYAQAAFQEAYGVVV